MKPTVLAAAAIALAAAAGCSGPAGDAPSAPAAQTGSAAPAPSESASAPAAAEPAPAREGGLPGTAWSYTGLTLTFFEDGKLHVKGGVLGDEGLEGTYTLSGTVLNIAVGGQELAGNFDGAALTIEDGEAERLN